MPFITFIYRIGTKTYYGKYVSSRFSDDHEGLDNEIKSSLMRGLRLYQQQHNSAERSPLKYNQVKVGILSYSNDEFVPTFSSQREIACFDFYCDDSHHTYKTYVNGKLLEKV